MRLLLALGLAISIALITVWVLVPRQSHSPYGVAANLPHPKQEVRETTPDPIQSVGLPQLAGPGASNFLEAKVFQVLPSLRDTQIPDGLHEDENGNLIADSGLQLLFDFFLLAQNDTDKEQLDQTVADWIRSGLSQSAADQALDLWQRYKAYQAALFSDSEANASALNSASLSLETVEHIASVLEQRSQLQQQWLPEVADNWFGNDNAYDAAMLEQLRRHTESPASAQHHYSSATESPIKPSWQQERNPEYEQQLAQLRDTAAGIDTADKLALEAQLRQQYFSSHKAYIRQSLRDLSR